MSANKHTNKLKLQNYAYEVSDNGVFIHPKETSNVWFQPFTYDNVAHAYYPIPGHGDYPFIEASDIDWRPYKIDGHDVVTSYDLIHSMETMSSSYWVAGEGVSSIVRVLDHNIGTAVGAYAISEGIRTQASGEAAHAEGDRTIAQGKNSHAEGFDTKSIGSYSHAEGMSSYVSGNYAHGEGKQTFATGNCSHAEGLGEAKLTDYKLTSSSSTQYTVSDIVNDVPKQNDLLMYNGIISRVVLFNSTTNVLRVSPSLGTITSPTQVYKITGVAFDVASHVEGSQNIAIGGSSHAEGIITLAVGGGSHTEGFGTVVRGNYGHAEGVDTVASGASSHAEGEGSTAWQKSSHAEGNYTRATNLYEHAQGTYNLSTRTDTLSTFGSNGNTLHSIGIGTSDDNRKNAVEVMQNGDMYVINIGDYDGTNFATASTLQESLASSTAYAATKVNQIIATGNASYRLLFKYSPNDNPENSYTYFADSIWYNPSIDALTNKGPAYFGTNSGYVGIGNNTSSGQKKLHVVGQSTFTGIMNIDSNGLGAANHINFNRVGYNYVNLPNDTGTYFAVSFGSGSQTNTKLAVSKTAVFPGRNTNAVDLGTQENYWKNSYVTKYHTPSYEISETTGGRLAIGTHSQQVAAPVNVGNLLVSNAWADYTKVPAMGAYIKGQIRSGIQTGTAPFVVDSTTKVTNLNADFLDGEHSHNIRAYPNNNGDLIYSWTPYLEAGVRPPGVPSSAGDPILAFGEAPYTYCVGPITGRSVAIASNFIPVKAGDTICGEIWGYRELSEDDPLGAFYCGIQRFDRNKNPISSNVGTEYMVMSSATLACDGAWHRYYGSKTLPTSHTSYNGSDGGPVYYIKVYVLVNYRSSGAVTPTYIGGVNFYRTNPLNDNRYVNVTGDTMTGRLQITYNEDVSTTGSNGALVVGAFDGLNIGIDNNEIMARNNGAVSTLNLNVEGGPIAVGGPITRFYKNASDEPMIVLTSNDKDTWLWRINWDTTASSLATSAKYGFGLKYIGTGIGNDNSLVLYADNQAGTQVKAVEVKQNGVTYTYAYTYFQKTVNLWPSIYEDTNATGALNLNNSDIYNVNSIKFADASGGPAEGLQWKRSSGNNVDSIWVLDGEAYITPNRAWKGTATNYKFLHEGNLKNHQFTNSAYGVLLSYTTPTKTSTQLELRKENTWGRYYGVVATTNGYAYVNVPWNDANIGDLKGQSTDYGYMVSFSYSFFNGNSTSSSTIQTTILKPTNTAYGVIRSAAAVTKSSGQLSTQTTNIPGRYYGVSITTDGIAYTDVPWMNDSVTQKISSADTTYNLLLKNSSDSTDQTAYVNYSSNIFYNPSKQALTNNGPTYLAKMTGLVEVGSELNNMNSKLYTYGDTFTSGTTYVKGGDAYLGSGTNAQCHLKYDNNTKCIKFIFD